MWGGAGGGGGKGGHVEGLHQRSRKKGVASAPTSVCHVSVFACREKYLVIGLNSEGKFRLAILAVHRCP